MGDDGTRRKSGRPFHPYDAACVVISEWNDGVPVIRHSDAAIFPYNNLEIRKNRVNTHTHTHTGARASIYVKFFNPQWVRGIFILGGTPFSSETHRSHAIPPPCRSRSERNFHVLGAMRRRACSRPHAPGTFCTIRTTNQ